MFKSLAQKLKAGGSGQRVINWRQKNDELVALINQGDLDTALPLAQSLLEFVDRKYPRDAAEKATSYNNMGMVFLLQRDYDLAEECFRDALAMRKRIFGHDHNEVAVVQLNLVELYKVQAREILMANRVTTTD